MVGRARTFGVQPEGPAVGGGKWKGQRPGSWEGRGVSDAFGVQPALFSIGICAALLA